MNQFEKKEAIDNSTGVIIIKTGLPINNQTVHVCKRAMVAKTES